MDVTLHQGWLEAKGNLTLADGWLVVEEHIWGILAYPCDPTKPEVPPAEQASPWRLDAGRAVIFATLPHAESEATARLRELLNLVTTAGRLAQLASA